MANHDDNESLLGTTFSAVKDAALNKHPSYEDETTERDEWWLRWLKFASVIIVPAVVLGCGFWFADLAIKSRSGMSSRMERLKKDETVERMNFKFWLGAGIGGGFGLIYVAKCIIRKEDP
ncbi:MAG: hypothetical protein K0Q55_3002 [Verrucomicrobia bacterium]|jgi:hypothetical protein|nr:hypothetical protein [Verrucomicrobiota bacterium]